MSSSPLIDPEKIPNLNYNKPLISIWIGQGLSTVGSGIFTVALAWEVIRLTGSTLAMGTVLLATMLPKILFSFFGGVLGESYSKKRILQLTDFLRLTIGVLWVISMINREVTMVELYTISIIYGLIQAFFAPTYNSILPELLKNNEIDRAVNINLLIFRTANLLSPILGGILITLLSFKWIILIDALSFGMAFLFSFALPNLKVNLKKKESILKSLLTGSRYFFEHKIIFWSVVLITFANIAAVTTSVNLPKLIQSDLMLGAKAYGWIISAFGAGSLITLSLLSSFPLKKHEGKLYLYFLMTGGLMLSFLSVTSSLYQILFVMFMLGASFTVTSSISTIILQKETSSEYRSRVFGIAGVSSLLSPIGYLIWGIAGDTIGNFKVFLCAGIIVVVVGTLGFFTKLSEYSTE